MCKSKFKEATIEKRIREYAHARGCRYRKFTSPGLKGVQDRIIITPYGVTGYLEVKKPGGATQPKQFRDATALRAMKVPIEIVDGVAGGMRFIDKLLTLRLRGARNGRNRYL